MRLKVALLFIALNLCLGFAGTAVRAHVFQSSEAIVFFNRDATSFALRLNLNLEAILAGIDPGVTDTSDSPNATEYDRLRRLPPEELQKEFEAFLPEFIAGLRIDLDGEPAEVTVQNETFRDVGDLSLARASSVLLNGALPPGAKVFTFGWDSAFGTVALRTISARARSSHIEIIENGETSTPLVIDDLKARSMVDMITDFMVIGFQHIIPKGLDHILFVLGIFLLSIKLRPILAQVTAFTLAHTVTLGLGTLGLIDVPALIVEPLIAASIVYVAVENILHEVLSPWRPVVVFMFGLLHGLGFAGILKQFNIPDGEFVPALLSFNIGVEIGQLAVIAAGFLLVGLWFGNKPWYRQRVVIPGSTAIAAVGAFWFVQRVAF
ncbi:HupE/UreJ family protein [Actibacterium sp.]|uniref:HupE/UreJ family protein n=1 Tax=Actibacterium sp. TaxID=1872125 RepID=UPI00257CB2D6|nr:HupE/UreJ family protein [Actibacterium sp.]